MPDTLDGTGLTIESLSELVTNLTSALKGVYGSDINVDQNSPDGQAINIYCQGGEDYRELLSNVYNSFNPDNAVGTVLDERVAINNIQRAGGTFTIQPIAVTVNATVNLQGLDANFNNINGVGYTIQDNSGNQYILQTSQTLTAGTTTVDFRAATLGAVTPIANTITIPVTIVPGVISVNNAVAPTSIGQNEETDAQLRVRRAQSVSLGSVGYLNGLQGALLALAGVTEARVYNNGSGSTVNTIPAHSIWVVVAGGADSDIANTIYNRLSDGCGQKGSVTYDITTPAGDVFEAQWDVPVPETLYIEFNIQPTVSGASFNQTAIKASIVANLSYTIGQFAETSSLTAIVLAAINANGGGGVPTDVKISVDNSTWEDYLTVSTLASQWSVVAGNITITVL